MTKFVNPFDEPNANDEFVNPFEADDGGLPKFPEKKKSELTRTWGEAAKDTGLQIASGTAQLIGGLASGHEQMSPHNRVLSGLARLGVGPGPTTMLAEGTDAVTGAIEEKQSDTTKAKRKEFRDVKGFGASAKHLISDPVLLGGYAAEQIPTLATLGYGTAVRAGSVAGRIGAKATQKALAQGATKEAAEEIGKKAALAARPEALKAGADFAAKSGTVLETTDAQKSAINDALSLPEEVWQANEDYQSLLARGLEPGAAKRLMATDAGMMAALVAAPLAYVGGKISAPFEAEVFTRGLSNVAGLRGLVSLQGARKVGQGILAEAAEETVQEGGNQFGVNVGVQGIDPNRGLMEGVPEAAATGAVLGGAMGGGMGAGGVALSKPQEVLSSDPDQQQAQAPEPKGTFTRALNIAANAIDEQANILRQNIANARNPKEQQDAIAKLQEHMEQGGRMLPQSTITVNTAGNAATQSQLLQSAQLEQQAKQAQLQRNQELGITPSTQKTIAARNPDYAQEAPKIETQKLPEINVAEPIEQKPLSLQAEPESQDQTLAKEALVRSEISKMLDRGIAPDNKKVASAFGLTPRRASELRREVQMERKAPKPANAKDDIQGQRIEDAPAHDDTAQELNSAEANELRSALAANINPITGQEFASEDERAPFDAEIAQYDSANPVKSVAEQAATSPNNDLPVPTKAQKEAGNYKKGHTNINGLNVSIENPAGSKRDPKWPALKNHYGYIKRTTGADKDQVDVFLSDDAHNEDHPVFIVDQNNKDGSFDEHKVMIGFADEKQARKAYLSNYEKGWTGLGAVKQMSQDEFKAWLKDGDTKAPAVESAENDDAAKANAIFQEEYAKAHPDHDKPANDSSIVKALLSKDNNQIRQHLKSLSNNAWRKTFERFTGIKLPRTVKGTMDAVDAFTGVSPEQRAKIDAERKATKEKTKVAKELERSKHAASKVSVKDEDTGAVTNGQEYIDSLIAKGFYRIHKRKEGAITRTYLANSEGDAIKIVSDSLRRYAKAAIEEAKKVSAAKGEIAFPALDVVKESDTDAKSDKSEEGKPDELADKPSLPRQSEEKAPESTSEDAENVPVEGTEKTIYEPTATGIKEFFKSLYSGVATLSDYKQMYSSFMNSKDAFIDSLNKATIKNLLLMLSPMMQHRYKNEKKSDIVDTVYRETLESFSLHRNYGPNSYLGTREGIEAHKIAKQKALDALVENTTEKELSEIQEQYKTELAELNEAKKERKELVEKSLENPETYQEYLNYFGYKKEQEKKTQKEARRDLTLEQRIRLDNLVADKRMAERAERKDEQREVNVASQTVDGKVIKTKHTKSGIDLFVVQADERVERDIYTLWNRTAKSMGGWYSKYRHGGAVPGFQFKNEESANAFLEFIGGKADAAQEQVKARRDAFADDKSQSATERLREMADRLDSNADDVLTADRKVNTARRARFAASAEASASRDKALAKTMRNVADGIDSGSVKYLKRLRQKVQFGYLNSVLSSAKQAKVQELKLDYKDRDTAMEARPDKDLVEYAQFPVYQAYQSDLASLARRLSELEGTKMLSRKLMKIADDVTADYIAFVKKPENARLLYLFSKANGGAAHFSSRPMAERSLFKSNLKGKAIVVQVKRGQFAIVASPKVALEEGLWKNDHDKKIVLDYELGEKIVEKAKADKKLELPYLISSTYENLGRLKAMGIQSPFEFRSALYEYVDHLEGAAKPSKIKELERAMIGRAKDGLDFFPTPEDTAQDMIDAAEITEGMKVLEPSAGMGHIAEKLRDAGFDPDVIEYSPSRRELLEEKGFNVVGRDFLEFKGNNDWQQLITNMVSRDIFIESVTNSIQNDGQKVLDAASAADIEVLQAIQNKYAKEAGRNQGGGGAGPGKVKQPRRGAEPVFNAATIAIENINKKAIYDRIIMNPPFSDRRDAQHVMHAYTLLKDGGRIVSIMGEGVFFGQDKKAQAFREWLESVGGTSEKLESGTFNDPSLPVSTSVNARLVVIDKQSEPSSNENQPLYSKPEPADKPFNSALLKSLEEAKGAPAKASADNWKQWLDGAQRRGEIKQAERDWLGVTERLNKITRTWKGDAPTVRIIETANELPARGKSGRGWETAEAYYDGSNTVWMIAGNLKNASRAEQVLAHEVFGHYGVESIVGKEQWNQIMLSAVKMRADTASIKNAALRAAVESTSRRYAKATPMTYAKELIAVMAERGVKGSILDRVISAAKRWLRALGFDVKWSDSEMRDLVSRGMKNVKEGSGIGAAPIIQAPFATEGARSVPIDSIFDDFAEEAGRPISELFREIAKYDDAFRYPISDKETLEGVFKDVIGSMTVSYSGTASTSFVREDGRESTAHKHKIKTADGENAYLYIEDKGNRMYLDASSLTPGHSGGTAMYMAIFNYARNAGKVFVGDPNGLSDEALLRRTELMAAAALKFDGDTSFMRPHPRQTVKDRPWFSPVAWAEGEHADNLESLLLSAYNNVLTFAPSVRNATYDFKTGRFLGADGQVITKDELARIASGARKAFAGRPPRSNYANERREAAFGRTTIARAILAATAIRTQGQEQSEVVGNAGRISGANKRLAPDGLGELLYSQTEKDLIEVDGVQRSTLNSDGKPIHNTEEGIKNFWRWFGDSKVVDSKGRPLVVYHRTSASFDAFNTERGDLGSHFGTAEQARNLRGGVHEKDTLMDSTAPVKTIPVYLRINEPIKLLDRGSFHADSVAPQLLKAGFIDKEKSKRLYSIGDKGTVNERRTANNEIKSILADRGYDGVVYKNKQEGVGNSFIAFDPGQIKSAIGNAGEYSADNDSILYSQPETVFDEIDKTTKSRFVEEARKRLDQINPKNLKENTRPAWLGALTLRHLAELAGDTLPQVGRYASIVQKMGTDRNKLQEAVGKQSEHWEKLQRKDRKGAAKAVEVMHESTLEGVDPDSEYRPLTFKRERLETNAKGTESIRWVDMAVTPKEINAQIAEIAEGMKGKDKATQSKMQARIDNLAELLTQERRRREAYPRLVNKFNALSEDWKQLYRDVKQSYLDQSKAYEDALVEKVEALIADGAVAKAETAKIRQHFESARLTGPYFPLARFGEFWISATDTNGEKAFFMYENIQDWRKGNAELKKNGYKVNKAGRKLDSSRQADGVSTGFLSDLMEVLDTANAGEAVKDDVYQLYLRMLPDLSIRKHNIHRKGTPGYSSDALRAYAGNMFHGSFQIARLRHSHKLDDALNNMRQSIKDMNDTDPEEAVKATVMHNEMRKRHDWVMSPKDSAISNKISSLGFAWYLGLTPAAAFVNFTQVPIVSFPVLASKFGVKKAFNALMSGTLRATRNVDGNLTRGLSDEEQAAFKVWYESGAIDRSLAHNLAGLSETDTQAYSPAYRRVMNGISFLFHKTEVINRESTALAAFNLARKHGMSFNEATAYAENIVWETQFDYSNANRARFMQSDVAKVLLMFRQYSLNISWLLWRNFYQSFKGETPEVKSLARKKLAGVLGMTAAFSGTLGLPLMSVMFGVANAAADAFGDDDEPWDAETAYRNFLADHLGQDAARIITSGIVEPLTGAEVSSRTSLDNLWLREPDRELEGAALAHYWMEQVAGPIGGIFTNALKGKQLIHEGQTMRGIEAMVPKAIKDSMRAVRYATEGAKTLRGDPLMESLSMPESLLQAAGFSPARLNDRYDANRAIKNYESTLLTKRQRIMDAYAMAVRNGDNELKREMRQKINDWNRKNRDLRIDHDTLRRSLAQRARYSDRATAGIVVDKRVEKKAREQGRFAE